MVVGSVLGRVNGKRGIVIAPPGLVGDYKAGTGWDSPYQKSPPQWSRRTSRDSLSHHSRHASNPVTQPDQKLAKNPERGKSSQVGQTTATEKRG